MRSVYTMLLMFAVVGCGEKSAGTRPSVASIAIPESGVRVNTISCSAATESADAVYGSSRRQASGVAEALVDVAAFRIDQRTVDCEQLKACQDAGVCSRSRSELRCNDKIVIGLHAAAVELCHWRGGRLPTYEEWQRAIRGMSARVSAFPNGTSLEARRKCLRGAHETQKPATCDLYSDDKVIFQSVYGDEWVGAVMCPRETKLLVAARVEIDLDEYVVHRTHDAAYQFRCVTP